MSAHAAINEGDTDVKFRMLGVAAATVGLLLAGCEAPASQPTESASPTPSVAPKKVPDVAGKSFSDARSLVRTAGIVYEVVGSDGVKFTETPENTAVVVSSDPASGENLQPGAVVTFKINGTQAEATAAAAAKEAARVRSLRYSFKCSASESAITAKDNKSFTKLQEIPRLKSCDLHVGGKWYMDRYDLEPDEAAVVKQIGVDGGDASAPYMAYGSVLLLCAVPPKDGWDHRYGEYPTGPKIKAVAKAAATMCPDAPFADELVRVAGGVAPAPKTSMEDGTFVVGKDIAEGAYQVSVPAGANGVHNCYWERTGPQGSTIENDFISFAPQGSVVTLYAGEGFVSQRCGSWTKVG